MSDVPANGPAASGTADPGGETPEVRLRRLRLRSWRRGMREMDLILGPYADACLGSLGSEALDLFELLLEESDPDLYLWIARVDAPADHATALDRIRVFHRIATN